MAGPRDAEITGRILLILDTLEEGVLALSTLDPTVNAILSWLERDDLAPEEVMQILDRLGAAGRLGKFLNLVAHRRMRDYLHKKKVPWEFIFENWEPRLNDSGAFYAGFIIGAGENLVDAIRMVGVVIGSIFSEELAKERRQLFDGVAMFLRAPIATATKGIELLNQSIEEKMWNLEFFEAGRTFGNLTVTLLTLPEAIEQLPALFRKGAAVVAKVPELAARAAKALANLVELTVAELRKAGNLLAELRELALSRQLAAVTSDGTFLSVGEDLVRTDRAGTANAKVAKEVVLKETTGTPAAQARAIGLARLNVWAKGWLREKGLWALAEIKLADAGNEIVDAINTFYGTEGFEKVTAGLLSNSYNLQKGSSFVMRYALAKLADRVGKAFAFEVPTLEHLRQGLRAPRIHDIRDFFGGIQYEFKSRWDIAPGLVWKGGERLGQLALDIVKNINTEKGLEGLRRLRWVFDSAATSLTREQIARQLYDLVVREGSLFAGHTFVDPLASADDLYRAIYDIIEPWP
jgi:hypothetical protein